LFRSLIVRETQLETKARKDRKMAIGRVQSREHAVKTFSKDASYHQHPVGVDTRGRKEVGLAGTLLIQMRREQGKILRPWFHRAIQVPKKMKPC